MARVSARPSKLPLRHGARAAAAVHDGHDPEGLAVRGGETLAREDSPGLRSPVDLVNQAVQVHVTPELEKKLAAFARAERPSRPMKW